MSVAGAVGNGLHAAFLLARGRADGMRFVSADMAGAARSFWALPVAVPTVVAIRLIAWLIGGVPAQGGRLLLRDLLVAVVSWLAFAVLSHRFVGAIGRGALWPRFITAWNWCNVVGNFLVLLGMAPALFGMPSVFNQAAQLVTLGWALWLEWYAVRLSLQCGPLLAIYVVLLDQMIGVGFALTGMSFGAGQG
jgi:hypothetical protein